MDSFKRNTNKFHEKLSGNLQLRGPELIIYQESGLTLQEECGSGYFVKKFYLKEAIPNSDLWSMDSRSLDLFSQ